MLKVLPSWVTIVIVPSLLGTICWATTGSEPSAAVKGNVINKAVAVLSRDLKWIVGNAHGIREIMVITPRSSI